MDIKEYKFLTATTAIYPDEKAIEYLGLGLASEGGEVAGVIKKYIRDGFSREELKTKLSKELGDTLWYWARLCDELDLNPEEVMEENYRKLIERKQNNTLKGDGDNR